MMRRKVSMIGTGSGVQFYDVAEGVVPSEIKE
jgi:hypothetical protein